MRGVILAGGKGTRLYPVTKAVNKHLLPVYLHPMILYPLKTLVGAGITEIMLITNEGCLPQFKAILEDGAEYGCKITYGVQENPVGGIADGFNVAKEFVGDDSVALILGDNLFLDEQPYLKNLVENGIKGAGLFLQEVEHPQRFGVATVNEEGKIVELVEKPKEPKSNLAATGLYVYDNTVFELIKTIKPSERGELEITDLNLAYLEQNNLHAAKAHGEWFDAGSFESLFIASQKVRSMTTNLLDGYQRERLAKGLKVDLSFMKMPLTVNQD